MLHITPSRETREDVLVIATVKPVGTYRYCEYPALLVRVVLTNPDVFPEAKSLPRLIRLQNDQHQERQR